MKTTIDIADDLLLEAKRVAAERRETLKTLTEDGLRLALERRRAEPPPFCFPVSKRTGGLRPEILKADPNFYANLRDHAYDEPGAR